MLSPQIKAAMCDTVELFARENRAFSGYDVTIETRDREKIKLFHRDVRDMVHQITAISNILSRGYERTLTDMWECQSCGFKFVTEEGCCPDDCPSCEQETDFDKKGNLLIYHPHGFDVSKYEIRVTMALPNGPMTVQSVTNAVRDMRKMARPEKGEAKPVVSKPALSRIEQAAIDLGIQNPPGQDFWGKLEKKTEAPSTNSVIDRLKQAAKEITVPSLALDYRNRLVISADMLQHIGLGPSDDCFIIPDINANTVRIESCKPEGEVVCIQKIEHDGTIKIPARTLKMAGLSQTNFGIKATDNGLVEIKGVD